jgi:DNA ligase-associated metallophosphoesterase
MKVVFGGHEFLMHPSGILFWPLRSMAIVSDLHLEKGSHFAKRGYFLPPYDSHETLVRLFDVFQELKPENTLILGDTFHDEHGFNRLHFDSRALFKMLLNYNPIWITGNHDGDFVPKGFSAHTSLKIENITFNHQAAVGIEHEISGHYHPKVDIFHLNARVSRPCFIEDGNKMILPAFGAYTGGLSIQDKAIMRLLSKPRIYALGEKIYALKI